MKPQLCVCASGKGFNRCCQPFLSGSARPKTPVQEADAGTPGIEKEHKKTDVGGGKNKKKNGKKK